MQKDKLRSLIFTMETSLKILEIGRVSPLPTTSVTGLSLPLSYFDRFWLGYHPVERLFFYSRPQAAVDSYFLDTVLPKLKHSLSVALQRFLPLAGNVIWPPDSGKSFIKYQPVDGVSFIVAQSDADFDQFSSSHSHMASDSRALVPQLHTCESSTSVLAMLVTLFPRRGFSIGISTHHAILDGKSSMMFMKAWAYLCRESHSRPLLKELRPFMDCSVINDPKGIEIHCLNSWAAAAAAESDDSNAINRSVQLPPDFIETPTTNKE